jgi:hypothetical protein
VRHRLRVIVLFTRVVALTRASRAVVRVVLCAVHTLFCIVSRVVTRHSRGSCVVRARRSHVWLSSSSCCSCVWFVCCLTSFACVAHVVRTRCRTLFACVACAIYMCRSPCRASLARITRVDHMCRATSTRDNKLFSLINTHVNNVNSSGHIF